jgi:hypothetical protein
MGRKLNGNQETTHSGGILPLNSELDAGCDGRQIYPAWTGGDALGSD